MVREYLTDFGYKYGPWDTAQITHTVGTNASIFGPDLDHSESFLEVFDLPSSQLQYHQVIFSTQNRCLALLVTNRLDQIIGNYSLYVSRNSLLIELTETDIDVGVTIVKCDDGHFSIHDFRQMLHFIVLLKSVVQVLEKVCLSFDEIGAYTDKIDIWSVRFKVKDIWTKGE